jgi:hypothetical protein
MNNNKLLEWSLIKMIIRLQMTMIIYKQPIWAPFANRASKNTLHKTY